jgi:hypothetical protein
VKHQAEYHPSNSGNWRMLIAKEAKVARDKECLLEPGMSNARIPSGQQVWMCLHCFDRPAETSCLTLDALELHLLLQCVSFFRYSVFLDLTSSSTTKVTALTSRRWNATTPRTLRHPSCVRCLPSGRRPLSSSLNSYQGISLVSSRIWCIG